jgi:hypothetical protein
MVLQLARFWQEIFDRYSGWMAMNDEPKNKPPISPGVKKHKNTFAETSNKSPFAKALGKAGGKKQSAPKSRGKGRA